MTYSQAIVTKFIGPSNTKPSRIKATASAGSVTISKSFGIGHEHNHHAAANALATKMKWVGHWACGGLPDGLGNVYVYLGRHGASPIGFAACFEIEPPTQD